ncbi:transposable element Tcb1 transposase [Trichonephila clavipes]|nr:transposable element Tcb1 transposase [Trichonephila clavipes]
MSSNGVGKLECIASIMNKYDYTDVLKNSLKESATQFGLGSSFRFRLSDLKHTAEIVKLWLWYHIPNLLHTLLQSPDLNPIEHPWDLLECRMRQYNISTAPAREDCSALAATTASLTVRCPQRYVHGYQRRI